MTYQRESNGLMGKALLGHKGQQAGRSAMFWMAFATHKRSQLCQESAM
jgi:hypothetical protein